MNALFSEGKSAVVAVPTNSASMGLVMNNPITVPISAGETMRRRASPDWLPAVLKRCLPVRSERRTAKTRLPRIGRCSR